jgi:hypothetical protein
MLSRRGISCDSVCHHLNKFCVCHRSPPVPFHWAPIHKFSVVIRIHVCLQEIFRKVYDSGQIEVVHIRAIDWQLACELRSDSRPIGLLVVPQIISVVARVVRDGMIDMAHSVRLD